MGDRAVRSGDDHGRGEAEGLAEPGDRGGCVAVAQAGNDVGGGLGHRGFLRAPQQRVIVRGGGVFRLRRHRRVLGLGALGAARAVAARRAEGEEGLARDAEGLADLGHDPDRAKHERAVLRLGNFDDEGVGYGLAVGVERDRAAERGLEAEVGEGRAEQPVSLAQVAAGLFEGEKQGLGIDVVGEREQARCRARLREALPVAPGERVPRLVVLALRDRQRRNRPQQQGADGIARREQAGVQGRGVRHDGGLPAGLPVGFEKARRRAGGQRQEQRVRLGGGGGLDEVCGVARAGRDPVPGQHLAAEGAIVQREAHELRVGQGIVLGDGDDRADALLLVGIVPEPRDPLHAVGIEAEEIVGRRAQCGVLRRRGAVDERHRRHAPGKIADRDALDPGEGADDDARAALDEMARLRGRRVRCTIGGFDERFDAALSGASPRVPPWPIRSRAVRPARAARTRPRA